jgi:hypothetical protein
MENKTFTRELTYLSQVFDQDKNDFVKGPVTKPVSFYELSQTDPKQHALFFMMKPLYENIKTVGGGTRVIANPKVVKDLTVEAIDILLIVDDNFTITDKAEFMNDGFALLEFGTWFLEEKFTPFFLLFLQNYQILPKTTKKQKQN